MNVNLSLRSIRVSCVGLYTNIHPVKLVILVHNKSIEYLLPLPLEVLSPLLKFFKVLQKYLLTPLLGNFFFVAIGEELPKWNVLIHSKDVRF